MIFLPFLIFPSEVMISIINQEMSILGHQEIIGYLDKSVNNERLAHAYLFLGAAGLGKRTIALRFFRTILDKYLFKNAQKNISGKCIDRREFDWNSYPDFHEVCRDPDKKNIGIEQVRELRHNLNLKSSAAGYKFALLNEVECLTLEAANSFLKTLEEPAPKTVIILLGKSEEAIPKTILSRCQVIRFRPVPGEEIRHFLKEKKKISPFQSKSIAKISRGRPGLAIALADNPEIIEEEEGRTGQFIELVKSSLNLRLAEITRLKSSQNSPEEIRRLFEAWQTVSRDLFLSKLGLADLASLEKHKITLENIAAKKKLGPLREILEFSLLVPALLNNNINPKIIFDNYLLKI